MPTFILKTEGFKKKNNQKVSSPNFVFFSEIFRWIQLIFDIEKYRWKPKIFHLSRAPINSHEKIIGVWFIREDISTTGPSQGMRFPGGW